MSTIRSTIFIEKFMKNNYISNSLSSVCFIGLILGAGSAMGAAEGEVLAQKNGCIACHAIDKKLVGPSFQEISKKYKGDSVAQATLIAKVKAGGTGVWGKIPMPPQSPKVSEADIKTMVDWTLGLS